MHPPEKKKTDYILETSHTNLYQELDEHIMKMKLKNRNQKEIFSPKSL